MDFRPDAIVQSLHLMKSNPGIGALCNRIHPSGSWLMQWYQMYEYAIGHWLHKSTEDVFGAVLCSPGCFSLFRGNAILSDNVLKTYMKVSTEAKQFLQRDMGEDRWLCTLLIKQGWSVRYSAASDAFTAAPENFEELYNQRGRWIPSTLVNILDLLSDYSNVTRKNDDISMPYILYQTMFMICTIISPVIVFLILVYACSMIFYITIPVSLFMNLVPLIYFCVICWKG